MCSRYSNTKDLAKLAKAVAAVFRFALLAPRFNIAPTQAAPVLVKEHEQAEMKLMRWGLIPHWSKAAPVGNQVINARQETLREKPSFRQALEQRRCLVPADSYYEWKDEAGKKQPFRVMLQSEEPFCFAGLWERWLNPVSPTSQAPQMVESFAIITKAASHGVARLHARMPVIISPELYDTWLENHPHEALFQAALNQPVDTGLKMYPVSQRLNSAANDDVKCVEPVELPRDLFEPPWWKV